MVSSEKCEPGPPEVLTLTVALEEAGSRLDQLLARRWGLSRARLQKLLKAGLVKVNSRPREAAYRVRGGDDIVLTLPPPEPSHLTPEPQPLAIVFEDRDLLVVHKPPGLVVHPGAGHSKGTLLNALLHHCPELKEIGEVNRPGLVHRLDKDTSGLMVVAKTDLAHQSLVRQFQQHQVVKKYLALVWGRLPQREGEIAQEVGRHPTERQKMSVHPRRGKEAVTFWRVLKEFPGPLTLVELAPQTGRTHQLRVHLASEGHPVLGDATYGGGASRLKGPRQTPGTETPGAPPVAACLAAGSTHPRTGERLAWEAPLPEDFQAVVNHLEEQV